ncbi:MAG: Ldh family oxidoreductase [Chloroflexi bacterium]|nr:Ldh family oxidoreductase [Chloroflexota bacterium]
MVVVRIEEARAAAAERLVRGGVPRDEGETAARICLEAELLGKKTHGFIHLRRNLIQYEAGADRRRELRVMRETPVSALVDGGFHFSYTIHDLAARLTIEKATTSGLAIVGARNGGASGPLGYYTGRMAEAGLVGIALNSAPSMVVPPGGVEPLLSTNPLSVAIPRRTAPPLVLDMATSAISFNAIALAQRNGVPLPIGAAVDPEGVPTTDPAQTVDETGRARLLPFGGYKGFGLAFAIELLCGASLGTEIGGEKIQPFIHEPAHFCGLYLAYRPDLFVEREVFDNRVERLVADVKASRRAPGVSEIRLPGEASERRRAEAVARGTIDLEDATWAFLAE